MAKTAFSCSECGHRSLQWLGKCSACGAWDSYSDSPSLQVVGHAAPVALSSIDLSLDRRLATGVDELDRVLGGGLVPGSVVLLAGEPGVGKSTLALQAAAGLEASGADVVLVCGEESLTQVAQRAVRLGKATRTLATSVVDIDGVISAIAGASVAVIDSIQSLRDSDANAEPGSITQVKSCAARLAAFARDSKTAIVLVGHVTKDGSVAGPRTLEHLVDVVISFEGDRGNAMRSIRGVKNRYGATGELGLFEMTPHGLAQIADPSELLLADRKPGSSGVVVGCVFEGRRPVAVEIQTLTVTNGGPMPRRVCQGVEPSRLGLVLAVLNERAKVHLSSYDVYCSVAGGFRAWEPGIDLALAMALVSSRKGIPVPADLAAVGEIGLSGEIRAVPGMESRIKELTRLGFSRVVVPESVTTGNSCVIRASQLVDATKILEK